MLLLLLLLYWLTEYLRYGASLQTLEKLFSCPITTLSTWCLVTGAEPVHSRVSFQQNQSGNSLSGAKKVCDKIWPKLQLKVLFMAKFALNKSC